MNNEAISTITSVASYNGSNKDNSGLVIFCDKIPKDIVSLSANKLYNITYGHTTDGRHYIRIHKEGSQFNKSPVRINGGMQGGQEFGFLYRLRKMFSNFKDYLEFSNSETDQDVYNIYSHTAPIINGPFNLSSPSTVEETPEARSLAILISHTKYNKTGEQGTADNGSLIFGVSNQGVPYINNSNAQQKYTISNGELVVIKHPFNQNTPQPVTTNELNYFYHSVALIRAEHCPNLSPSAVIPTSSVTNNRSTHRRHHSPPPDQQIRSRLRDSHNTNQLTSHSSKRHRHSPSPTTLDLQSRHPIDSDNYPSSNQPETRRSRKNDSNSSSSHKRRRSPSSSQQPTKTSRFIEDHPTPTTTTPTIKTDPDIRVDIKNKYKNYGKPPDPNVKTAAYVPDIVLECFWNWVTGVCNDNNPPTDAEARDMYNWNRAYCLRLMQKYGNLSEAERNRNLILEMIHLRATRDLEGSYEMQYDSRGNYLGNRKDDPKGKQGARKYLGDAMIPPPHAGLFIDFAVGYAQLPISSILTDSKGNNYTTGYKGEADFDTLLRRFGASKITDKYMRILDLSFPNSEIGKENLPAAMMLLIGAKEGIPVIARMPDYLKRALEKMLRLPPGYYDAKNIEYRRRNCRSQGSLGLDPDVYKSCMDLKILEVLGAANNQAAKVGQPAGVHFSLKGGFFTYHKNAKYEEELSRERLFYLLSREDIRQQFPWIKYINVYGESQGEEYTTTQRKIGDITITSNKMPYGAQPDFGDDVCRHALWFFTSRGDPFTLIPSGNDNIINIFDPHSENAVRRFIRLLNPAVVQQMFGMTPQVAAAQPIDFLQATLLKYDIEHIFNIDKELRKGFATSTQSAHPFIYSFTDAASLSRALRMAVIIRDQILAGKVITQEEYMLQQQGVIIPDTQIITCGMMLGNFTSTLDEKNKSDTTPTQAIRNAAAYSHAQVPKIIKDTEALLQSGTDEYDMEYAFGLSSDNKTPYMQIKDPQNNKYYRIDLSPGSAMISEYRYDDNNPLATTTAAKAYVKTWDNTKVDEQGGQLLAHLLEQSFRFCEAHRNMNDAEQQVHQKIMKYPLDKNDQNAALLYDIMCMTAMQIDDQQNETIKEEDYGYGMSNPQTNPNGISLPYVNVKPGPYKISLDLKTGKAILLTKEANKWVSIKDDQLIAYYLINLRNSIKRRQQNILITQGKAPESSSHTIHSSLPATTSTTHHHSHLSPPTTTHVESPPTHASTTAAAIPTTGDMGLTVTKNRIYNIIKSKVLKPGPGTCLTYRIDVDNNPAFVEIGISGSQLYRGQNYIKIHYYDRKDGRIKEKFYILNDKEGIKITDGSVRTAASIKKGEDEEGSINHTIYGDKRDLNKTDYDILNETLTNVEQDKGILLRTKEETNQLYTMRASGNSPPPISTYTTPTTPNPAVDIPAGPTGIQMSVRDMLQNIVNNNAGSKHGDMMQVLGDILNNSHSNAKITMGTLHTRDKQEQWKPVNLSDKQNIFSYQYHHPEEKWTRNDLSYYFKIETKDHQGRNKTFFLKIQPIVPPIDYRTGDLGDMLWSKFDDVFPIPRRLEYHQPIGNIDCNISFSEDARDTKFVETGQQIRDSAREYPKQTPYDRMLADDLGDISLSHLMYTVVGSSTLGFFDQDENLISVEYNGKIYYIFRDPMFDSPTIDQNYKKKRDDVISQVLIKKTITFIPHDADDADGKYTKFILKGMQLAAAQSTYDRIEQSGKSYESRINSIIVDKKHQTYARDNYIRTQKQVQTDIAKWRVQHAKFYQEPQHKKVLDQIAAKARSEGEFLLHGLLTNPHIIHGHMLQKKHELGFNQLTLGHHTNISTTPTLTTAATTKTHSTAPTALTPSRIFDTHIKKYTEAIKSNPTKRTAAIQQLIDNKDTVIKFIQEFHTILQEATQSSYGYTKTDKVKFSPPQDVLNITGELGGSGIRSCMTDVFAHPKFQALLSDQHNVKILALLSAVGNSQRLDNAGIHSGKELLWGVNSYSGFEILQGFETSQSYDTDGPFESASMLEFLTDIVTPERLKTLAPEKQTRSLTFYNQFSKNLRSILETEITLTNDRKAEIFSEPYNPQKWQEYLQRFNDIQPVCAIEQGAIKRIKVGSTYKEKVHNFGRGDEGNAAKINKFSIEEIVKNNMLYDKDYEHYILDPAHLRLVLSDNFGECRPTIFAVIDYCINRPNDQQCQNLLEYLWNNFKNLESALYVRHANEPYFDSLQQKIKASSAKTIVPHSPAPTETNHTITSSTSKNQSSTSTNIIHNIPDALFQNLDTLEQLARNANSKLYVEPGTVKLIEPSPVPDKVFGLGITYKEPRQFYFVISDLNNKGHGIEIQKLSSDSNGSEYRIHPHSGLVNKSNDPRNNNKPKTNTDERVATLYSNNKRLLKGENYDKYFKTFGELMQVITDPTRAAIEIHNSTNIEAPASTRSALPDQLLERSLSKSHIPHDPTQHQPPNQQDKQSTKQNSSQVKRPKKTHSFIPKTEAFDSTSDESESEENNRKSTVKQKHDAATTRTSSTRLKQNDEQEKVTPTTSRSITNTTSISPTPTNQNIPTNFRTTKKTLPSPPNFYAESIPKDGWYSIRHGKNQPEVIRTTSTETAILNKHLNLVLNQTIEIIDRSTDPIIAYSREKTNALFNAVRKYQQWVSNGTIERDHGSMDGVKYYLESKNFKQILEQELRKQNYHYALTPDILKEMKVISATAQRESLNIFNTISGKVYNNKYKKEHVARFHRMVMMADLTGYPKESSRNF